MKISDVMGDYWLILEPEKSFMSPQKHHGYFCQQ